MNEAYQAFLDEKRIEHVPTGLEPAELNSALFPFQADVVRWALRRGRSAIFADCGMGKTLMQLEWARQVYDHAGRVLILAPLAVSAQTVREAETFGIVGVEYLRDDNGTTPIVVTNYEMLEHFNPDDFAGVVLDESSILKSFDGKTRTRIIEAFGQTRFRLACTATPAPNDFMELGNHSEFVGSMLRQEMLATFFVHDGGETQKWRLKGHAEDDFWRWVCSWAVMIRAPSDLGYDDGAFILPPLEMDSVVVRVDHNRATEGHLFAMEARTLPERIAERRRTVPERAQACADLVAQDPDEPWLIWCNLNAEADAVRRLIPGAVEVRGSDTREKKEGALLGFASGEIQILVTKPKIAGHGMNWQHCARVVFVGLSDSYEQFYQAVRRVWRFGQERPVKCYIVTAETEGEVLRNVRRKEAAAAEMAAEMLTHTRAITEENVRGTHRMEADYVTTTDHGDGWTMHLGDCVDGVAGLDDDSIGYTVFSPPFASLYTYSNSDRDMGNCKSNGEFAEHFAHLIPELYRVTMPGRLASFHCMNLPTSKVRDGVIGLRDFRGELIRMFTDVGWIFHSEVCIWKDPVTAMQRTKALGLLYKQLKKDSCMSRQGIPDYLVTMRKPGDNPKRVEHTESEFPVHVWQRYASPVWMDVNPSRTLQYRSAREEKDERHICPLQLDVIERAIDLWSAEDDVVLSPFAGIGSEGYVAIAKGRRFIGFELKESYWRQAVANLKEAEGTSGRQLGLFAAG